MGGIPFRFSASPLRTSERESNLNYAAPMLFIAGSELSGASPNITEVFEQRERGFLLEKCRVIMRSSLENIEAGDFKIESLKEKEQVELPRWVAEELVQLNLAETTEEPFETELYRSLSREKMLGPFQVSNLPPDFYLRMRRRLTYLRSAVQNGRVRREDYEKVRATNYDLIGVRLGKLLSLSSSSTSADAFTAKLTPEEKVFFTLAQSVSRDWKKALLRDEP
jgi:hypothetical protein